MSVKYSSAIYQQTIQTKNHRKINVKTTIPCCRLCAKITWPDKVKEKDGEREMKVKQERIEKRESVRKRNAKCEVVSPWQSFVVLVFLTEESFLLFLFSVFRFLKQNKNKVKF